MSVLSNGVRAERIWIIAVGAAIGAAGALLAYLGNPANMGVCVACFIRDTAGALGLDGAKTVQYIRPEIAGFLLGAFILALVRREWARSPKASEGALIRFVIAFFVMLGCLVFLGCPLRMALRIGAGDLNAVVGLMGFVVGVGGAVIFLKKGFSLGEASSGGALTHKANALIMPVFAVALLALLFAAPSFINFSESGPASMHAPALIALIVALALGALCHQSGFCITGGVRDIFMLKSGWSFAGYLAIIAVAFIGSLIVGGFKLGFEGQPIAHTEALWNFLSMALVGFGSILIGGCPLRQLIKAGQGDSNAGICLLAFLIAGATAHNFGIASSAAGTTLSGKIAVIVGLAIAAAFAFVCRAKRG
jgi:YedE family putative selenium metabolism protein